MKRAVCFLTIFFMMLSLASCYSKDVYNETLVNQESDDNIINDNNMGEDSKESSSTDAHTHTWGEWKLLEASTCTKAGIESRECSCGETEKRDIAKKAHEYKSTVTAPTTESEGYTTYTCACGDSYVSDKLPKKIENSLVFDGVAKAKIVMPADASRCTLYARDRIQLSVKDFVGVELAENGDASFEILIGNTGREESKALLATLSADEYAIKADGKKIIIVASNEAFLYEAAKYFVDNYLTESYARITKSEITLLTDDINVKRAGDKESIHYQLSLNNMPSAVGEATYTLDNQRYGATDADPRIYRRQGGCFDGENYYQVFITKEEELAVVAKLNVKTGELIYSEPRCMNHANDATYNPYNNRLYVGYDKTIWVYDGDTLEFIETITPSHTASRISYSVERRAYVLGSYNIYDDSLTFTGDKIKSTLGDFYGDMKLYSQGTACDDTYIYSLLFGKTDDGKYNAYVGVLDWYGNTLAFATVEISGKFEPENISIVDGKLYIAACSTQPVATIYEVQFTK